MSVTATTLSIITAIAAVTGAVMSILVFCNTKKFRREQIDLHKQQIARYEEDKLKKERDAKKADVTASVQEKRKNLSFVEFRIEIFNKGRAMAQNVQIELSEEDLWNLSDEANRRFPMEIMQPGQKDNIPVSVRHDTRQKERIILRWDDDVSLDNEKAVDLTF